MPAIITTHSTPNSITIILPGSGRFNGPVWNGDSDPAPGDIQILSYGIAVWNADRTRDVYPWHTVEGLVEIF